MIIGFHKNFKKRLETLTPNQKKRVDAVLELFEKDPQNPQLRNHALHGKESGKRSIAAGGDLRLIFKVYNQYEKIIFVRIGTHNQVY